MKRNNGVNFFDVRWLVKSAASVSTMIDGEYVPARPLGWTEIPKRLKAVWLVWTGRADIVTWPGQ